MRSTKSTKSGKVSIPSEQEAVTANEPMHIDESPSMSQCKYIFSSDEQTLTNVAGQILSSLANQPKPLQAFVVGSAVTSQQELDRNAIKTASL